MPATINAWPSLLPTTSTAFPLGGAIQFALEASQTLGVARLYSMNIGSVDRAVLEGGSSAGNYLYKV